MIQNLEVKGAWGNHKFQLYHTYNPTTDSEEIKVYKSRNGVLQQFAVTALDFHNIPKSAGEIRKDLDYAIYYQEDANYTAYITSSYEDPESGEAMNFLYKHAINYEGNQRSQIDATVNLGTHCNDAMVVTDSIIVIACEADRQIKVIERENMYYFEDLQVVMEPQEVFYHFAVGTSGYRTDFLFVAGRMSHNIIFFESYSVYSKKYSLSYLEIIIPTDQTDNKGDYRNPEVKYDPIWDESTRPLWMSSRPFQVTLMDGQYLARIEEDQANIVQIYPICFLDQYLQSDGLCGQCDLGSYSLEIGASQCIKCSMVNNPKLSSSQKSRLEYYCKYKIGQISSSNFGRYRANEWTDEKLLEYTDDGNIIFEGDDGIIIIVDDEIVEETVVVPEPEQLPGKSLATIIAPVVAGAIFVLIWAFLAVFFIRRCKQKRDLEKRKADRAAALLKVSELGTQQRAQIKGPSGEEFENKGQREARFRKVAWFAPEHDFIDFGGKSKSQTTCAICVDDFTNSDVVRETKCRHLFHSQCLMMWAKQKVWQNMTRVGVPQCPCCNASLIEAPEDAAIVVEQSSMQQSDTNPVWRDQRLRLSINRQQESLRHPLNIISEDENAPMQFQGSRQNRMFPPIDATSESSANAYVLRRRQIERELALMQQAGFGNLLDSDGYQSVGLVPTFANVDLGGEMASRQEPSGGRNQVVPGRTDDRGDLDDLAMQHMVSGNSINRNEYSALVMKRQDSANSAEAARHKYGSLQFGQRTISQVDVRDKLISQNQVPSYDMGYISPATVGLAAQQHKSSRAPRRGKLLFQNQGARTLGIATDNEGGFETDAQMGRSQQSRKFQGLPQSVTRQSEVDLSRVRYGDNGSVHLGNPVLSSGLNRDYYKDNPSGGNVPQFSSGVKPSQIHAVLQSDNKSAMSAQGHSDLN